MVRATVRRRTSFLGRVVGNGIVRENNGKDFWWYFTVALLVLMVMV